jgi:AraC-like DNA-binding protein
MKLYIKYMVSIRCKMVVKAELEKLGLNYLVMDFGEVEIVDSISEVKREALKNALLVSGLELMDDKKAILIERVKSVIIEMVYQDDDKPKSNFSDHLAEKLGYDYTYLANLFSEVTGITIEYFTIAHRIERVKELLIYDELNLTQISYKLNYSSVAHLSTQFKKVTGLTPSFYKQLKKKRRSAIRNV